MGGGPSYQRTRNSLRNSIVAVVLQVASLLVGFWSRRVFLGHLGTEILGLNTTANSLLQFLNLAEMGIGAAIAVTLYKPLFADDRKTIREVVALHGWLYKRIAIVVIAGSLILGCFFPMIFSKMQLPLWYAYASFGVLLYGALLGYFVNYKQILLSADQKEYKIQFSFRLVGVFKLVAEAFAIKYLDNGFYWWLALEAVFSTISAVVLTRTVNKEYPYLKEDVPQKNLLHSKYPDVTRKIRQVMFQKIGGFVLFHSSPIIIYAFASLSLVGLYGNYTILTANLAALLLAVFNGLGGSVGNMVAEGNKDLIMKVFRELFSIRFLMVGVFSICLWILTEPFLTLWIGPKYLLSHTTLALIVLLFFLGQIRTTVDLFCNAYGIFWDIWAPIAEAAINIGLSVLLGSKYGLNGVLCGVAVSQIVMIYGWRPYLLFHWGMKLPLRGYIAIFAKHLAIFVAVFAAIIYLSALIPVDPAAGFGSFIVYGIIIFVATTLIFTALLYPAEKGMRSFIKRINGLWTVR